MWKSHEVQETNMPTIARINKTFFIRFLFCCFLSVRRNNCPLSCKGKKKNDYLCNEMTNLPVEFTEYTRRLMGDERFEQYLHSFEEDAPVSIRLNPSKAKRLAPVGGDMVPWCRNAFYLKQRPNFTFDPLFHAGCYYVQEAASMFLDEVLRQHLPSTISPLTSLDLCAAPGGKSTLLRAALPANCVLYSNEPMRNRASILLENVTKWGYENHHVTNLYPRDYRKAKMKFDLILCDVPMFGRRHVPQRSSHHRRVESAECREMLATAA